jgi:hypothetical protein
MESESLSEGGGREGHVQIRQRKIEFVREKEREIEKWEREREKERV